MVKFYFINEDLCFEELFDIALDINDPKLIQLVNDSWIAYLRWCRDNDRIYSLTDPRYAHDFISNCVALFNAV